MILRKYLVLTRKCHFMCLGNNTDNKTLLFNKAKNKILFPEMRVMRKSFTRAAANFFLTNLNLKFTRKELLKQHFSLLKNKKSYIL